MRNQKIERYSRLAPSLLIGACFSIALGGCAMSQSSYGHMAVDNTITVAETVERMELYVQPSGLNLSARDQDAVGNFVSQYSQSGQGPLYLNIPNNIAGGVGVGQAQSMINAYLASLGMGRRAIQMGQYNARKGAAAPIVVSYRRLATVPMDCQTGADLTYTSHNQPYANFGCTQAANLATLVDNPRQFLAPYDQTPVSVNRRVAIVGKYEKGEPTASARPSGQSGN